MESNQIAWLSEQYAIPGHVGFSTSAGGLVTVEVANEFCSGALTLVGGHVTSFCPKGQADVFWMSPNSAYSVGKAMRGGIPVCWPWFGVHAAQPKEMPKHGFVRTLLWSLKSTGAMADGATQVRLTLQDSAETRLLWPYAFELELALTFGSKLRIELIVRNPGSQDFEYTGALHSYFAVADVRRVQVIGLDQKDYLDKVENFAQKHQDGPVIFNGQVDRVYLDTSDECLIVDPVQQRTIRIAKEGSNTTVVWNPAENSVRMADVGAGNEVHFVCVETANAARDVVRVAPGREARLTAVIGVG